MSCVNLREIEESPKETELPGGEPVSERVDRALSILAALRWTIREAMGQWMASRQPLETKTTTVRTQTCGGRVNTTETVTIKRAERLGRPALPADGPEVPGPQGQAAEVPRPPAGWGGSGVVLHISPRLRDRRRSG
jgi:hypothetical protein